MTYHNIRQGLDIPLSGEAERVVEQAPSPDSIALRTADIIGMKFKVTVNEGDTVKRGQALCHPRQYPEIIFRSPASGVVREIRRGDRRAVQEIVIDPAESPGIEEFPVFSKRDIEKISLDDLRGSFLASGLWPLIYQRPLGKIAHPKSQPVAVFVNLMATAPLTAQPDIILNGREEDLEMGVLALSRFSSGKTYCTVHRKKAQVPGVDLLKNMKNVEIHEFDGPHPSGSVGVHIRSIHPLKRAETAWCVSAVDAADIGSFLRTGRFPVERVVALAGSAVKEPKYYRTRSGADLETILGGQVEASASVRYINGDVLIGGIADRSSHLGIRHSTVTVIPEGTSRDFMGWGMPGFKRYSALRTFASALLSKRRHALDTRIHGGVRPIISIGQWEKVFPFDIHLSYLIRAILAGDIQEAEELGLLELAEEDVALCAFIDPSKMEVADIIRQGLDSYEADNL